MIWTRLARIAVIAGLLLLGTAALTGGEGFIVAGLLLAVWPVAEGLLFGLTVHALRRGGIRLARRRPELGADGVTWTGVTIATEYALRVESPLVFALIVFEEDLPPGLAGPGGHWGGLAYPGLHLRWSSSIESLEPGLYEPPGFALRACSPSGLFHSFHYVEDPAPLKVYPNVFGLSTARASKKGLNRMLQLGGHRFPHKGGSGELLEIREFRPGDNRRRIAWKISARRDGLYVRELEREVPIRTTIFVDGGAPSRLGERGRRPLDHMIELAARVTRGTVEGRDPVGVTLFDEERRRILPPSGGRRHLFRVLRALAEFSTDRPRSLVGDLTSLSQQVEGRLHRRYPELMVPSLNPEPLMLLPRVGRARRRMTVERHMAAVMAVLLGPEQAGCRLAGATAVVEDDERFAELLTRFALHEGLALELDPALSVQRLDDSSKKRMSHLAKLLRVAMARAVDNELYVVVLDAITGDPRPIIEAARYGRARNHRLLFVLAEPELAGEPADADRIIDRDRAVTELGREIFAAEMRRSRRALRDGLKRLGLPVVRLDGVRSAAVVAREVQLLKHQGAAA